jgi:hypothetical protein
LNPSLHGCQAIFLGVAMKKRQDPLRFVPSIATFAKDSIEVLHGHLAPLHVLFSKDSELLMMIAWGTMTVLALLLVSAASQGMTGRKRTIAGLPQATALTRSWLRILRSLRVMIRIEFGQSGVQVP